MRFQRLLTAISCFLMLMAALRAQTPAHPRFEQLLLDMGLTHSSINCVLQDSRGFIWFGTWSGLVRYDGYDIRVFRHESNNPDGLRADPITSLYEDRQGRLWVGTLNAGLHRYDRGKDRFDHFAFDPSSSSGLSDNNVWSIFEDSRGYLWVGTKHGLNRLDEKNSRWTHFFAPPTSGVRTSDHIYDICETSDNSIWAATASGVLRLLPAAGALQWNTVQDGPNAALHNFCYRIKPCAAEPGALWLGTKGGLKKLYFQPGIASSLHTIDPAGPENIPVEDLLEMPSGDLWLATSNGLGLLEKGAGSLRRFHAAPGKRHALSSNSIHSLALDRSGILWIGTEKGLNKMNPNAQPFVSLRFDEAAHTSNNIASGICAAPNGFWVGTQGGGLHLVRLPGMTESRISHYKLQPKRFSGFAHFISGIARDNAGQLWITTKGAGLLQIHENELPPDGGIVSRIRQYSMDNSPQALNDDHVMALYLQHASETGPQALVWLGEWDGGIDLLDANTGLVRHFQTCGELSLTAYPNVAFSETSDADGRRCLWVGTRGNGLLQLVYRPSEQKLELLRHFKHQNGQQGALPDNKINCLFTDSRGRLWVGTGTGLCRLNADQNTFQVFSLREGLPSDDIQSILEGAFGQMWIGTQNGLASLCESPLSIRQFDVLDGLQDNFFYNNSAAVGPGGLLAFGGVEGISLFDPADIRMDTVAPLTAVSSILLSNRPAYSDPGAMLAAADGRLNLSYRDNVVTFELVSLHFAEPGKNRFAYKLEGFDPDWIYADADKRFAHYTNLPYKDFIFKVKSCNAAGVWSEEVGIPVSVSPPFWRSNWAYLLYALLFGALLYGGWRITHLRAEFRNRLALERLEREKLEEVNQLKLQFFTNISHELRTPLALIVSPLEQLLQEKAADRPLHATLSRMYRHAGRLLEMVGQLLDFRKSEAGLMPLRVENTSMQVFAEEIIRSFAALAREQHIELVFSAEKPGIEACIDRDQMEKVLCNLLSNALKFTPEGGSIRVELAENTLLGATEIRVSDTGPGIPAELLEKIFDPFYQTGQAAARRHFGGTGIGLALVKNIVEAHGGTVRAGNNPGRSGAMFTVSIPRGQAPVHVRQVPEAVAGESAPTYAATHPAEPRRPLLLVADDYADIRAYLRENLHNEFDIEEAANGREALEKARNIAPDLVLSDVAMPEMDGMELCQNLKRDLQTSHIPVVLLTARNALNHQLLGLETGADDYLTKPFNLQILRQRIRNLIDTRSRLREQFSRSPELSPAAVTANPIDEAFLGRVIGLVEQRLDDSQFTIDDLAHALAISRIQLYRKLKALSGESPNNFIRTIRLKHAARLLASGECNVSEAAYRTGFSDLKYFRERFREQFGVNPGSYTG